MAVGSERSESLFLLQMRIEMRRDNFISIRGSKLSLSTNRALFCHRKSRVSGGCSCTLKYSDRHLYRILHSQG